MNNTEMSTNVTIQPYTYKAEFILNANALVNEWDAVLPGWQAWMDTGQAWVLFSYNLPVIQIILNHLENTQVNIRLHKTNFFLHEYVIIW